MRYIPVHQAESSSVTVKEFSEVVLTKILAMEEAESENKDALAQTRSSSSRTQLEITKLEGTV